MVEDLTLRQEVMVPRRFESSESHCAPRNVHTQTHLHTHSHSHTHTHTLVRTSLNGSSARRSGKYLRNTQKTQDTNIHVLSGIRKRNPSICADADLRLRAHGYGHVRRFYYFILYYFFYLRLASLTLYRHCFSTLLWSMPLRGFR